MTFSYDAVSWTEETHALIYLFMFRGRREENIMENNMNAWRTSLKWGKRFVLDLTQMHCTTLISVYF